MHSVSKQLRLSKRTVKNLNEDGSIPQRRRRSPMTPVSANIRFVSIFEGVHWTEVVKRHRDNQKHVFSLLSTLRLP